MESVGVERDLEDQRSNMSQKPLGASNGRKKVLVVGAGAAGSVCIREKMGHYLIVQQDVNSVSSFPAP
jgi:trans-2-enoyl-CoA reductase